MSTNTKTDSVNRTRKEGYLTLRLDKKQMDKVKEFAERKERTQAAQVRHWINTGR